MTHCHVRDSLPKELPHLRRYALSLARDRAAADDLVQDTVLRAMERSHQFQPDTHLRRWLFTILRNASIDRARKVQRRGPEHELGDVSEAATARPATQEAQLALSEVMSRIGELDASHRRILRLSVFEGLDHATIAARMEIAVGTVKSRLSRARAKLAA